MGAPESDIDLLIRTSDSADGKYATLGRSPGNNTERVKFLHVNEPEDAGFQEGDYDSDGDSMSDSNESYISHKNGGDNEARARQKRMWVTYLNNYKVRLSYFYFIIIKFIGTCNKSINLVATIWTK